MIAAMAEEAERSFSADWLIFQNGGFLKARPRSLSAGSTWREGLLSAVIDTHQVRHEMKFRRYRGRRSGHSMVCG
jgi:hypothetical protein